MNYGLRFSLATVIGVLLSVTWFLLFFPGESFTNDFSSIGEQIKNAPPALPFVFGLIPRGTRFNTFFLFFVPYFAFLVFFVLRVLPSNFGEATFFRRIFSDSSRESAARLAKITNIIFACFALTWFLTSCLFAITLAAVVGANNSRLVWAFLGSYFVSLVIPLFLLYVPQFYVELKEEILSHPRFRRWFSFGRGGSSRWAGVRNYRRHEVSTFNSDPGAAGYQTKGAIYLGKTLFEDTFTSKHIAIKDDGHMLTIGCTGSGKSTTVLWTNIATYDGSMFIVDPKGEHAKMTFYRRADAWESKRPIAKRKTTKYHLSDKGFKGCGAYILDPYSQVPDRISSRYNPLDDIDIESNRVRGMLSAISDACVLPESSKNQHFVDMAGLLLEGVIAHVLSTYPKENHNLPYICDLLIGFDPELGVADPDKFNDLLIDMRMNDVAGKIAQLAASKISEMGDNEKGSVLSTLTRSVKWITDPAMRKHLETSDFSMKVLSDNKAAQTIYVVLPFEQMKEQARWIRTITNVSIGLIQNARKRPEKPVVFVLDEFPMMGGKLKKVEEGIVTLRSAGVKLWLIIQNIGQLKRDYDKNWETFVSSSTVQLFGVKDLETAQWASDMLGKAFTRRKERKGLLRKRIVDEKTLELATPSEIIEELGKSRPFQYVFPMEGLPMRLHRMGYKTIELEENKFKGLPLDGHFEE